MTRWLPLSALAILSSCISADPLILPEDDAAPSTVPPLSANGLPAVCGNGIEEPCARVIDLDVGTWNACVTLDDETMRCWGRNRYGQLGVETTVDEVTLPMASVHPPFDQLTLQPSHSCGLREGEAWCWGNNFYRILGGDGPAGPEPRRVALDDVTQIAGTLFTTCAIHGEASQVSCWGFRHDGTGFNPAFDDPALSHPGPTAIEGLDDVTVVQIAVARYHACALTTTGGVRCWGLGEEGRLGNGDDETQLAAVDVTPSFDGPIRALFGDYSTTCVLGPSLWCWGQSESLFGEVFEEPTIPPWWTGVGVIDVAWRHTMACAVYRGGALRCAGSNQQGQQPLLPRGTEAAGELLLIPGIDDAVKVGAGRSFACALRSDGSVWCWGANDRGQLGRGFTSAPLPTPAPVLFERSVP